MFRTEVIGFTESFIPEMVLGIGVWYREGCDLYSFVMFKLPEDTKIRAFDVVNLDEFNDGYFNICEFVEHQDKTEEDYPVNKDTVFGVIMEDFDTITIPQWYPSILWARDFLSMFTRDYIEKFYPDKNDNSFVPCVIDDDSRLHIMDEKDFDKVDFPKFDLGHFIVLDKHINVYRGDDNNWYIDHYIEIVNTLKKSGFDVYFDKSKIINVIVTRDVYNSIEEYDIVPDSVYVKYIVHNILECPVIKKECLSLHPDEVNKYFKNAHFVIEDTYNDVKTNEIKLPYHVIVSKEEHTDAFCIKVIDRFKINDDKEVFLYDGYVTNVRVEKDNFDSMRIGGKYDMIPKRERWLPVYPVENWIIISGFRYDALDDIKELYLGFNVVMNVEKSRGDYTISIADRCKKSGKNVYFTPRNITTIHVSEEEFSRTHIGDVYRMERKD